MLGVNSDYWVTSEMGNASWSTYNALYIKERRIGFAGQGGAAPPSPQDAIHGGAGRFPYFPDPILLSRILSDFKPFSNPFKVFRFQSIIEIFAWTLVFQTNSSLFFVDRIFTPIRKILSWTG